MTNILEKKSNENLKIAKSAINKSMFNVAMSRMYYAVFEILKYYFRIDESFFKSLNIKEDGFTHHKMPKWLNQYLNYKKAKINTNDYINISKLASLRTKREIADYSFRTEIDKQTTDEYIVYAEGIINFIKKINE